MLTQFQWIQTFIIILVPLITVRSMYTCIMWVGTQCETFGLGMCWTDILQYKVDRNNLNEMIKI